MNIEVLSLEERIGQTFIVGLDISNGINMYEAIDKIIGVYKAGGICLYTKNYANYEQLVQVINYIKEKSSKEKIPIFITVDQEGGRVNRMPKEFINLPSANKLAKYSTDKNDLVEKAGNVTAKILSKLGFGMNFAPVLDIKRFADNHPIGDRSFSEKYEEVTKFGIEYMKELQKQNILPVVKHFPGHGATIKDSHFLLPKIKKDIVALEEDLKPFEEAIKEGTDAILIGHLVIPRETGKLPTSLSKRFLIKYLRRKYHYNGLIITDDIRMKAIRFYFIGKINPIKMAFDAGNDMIMFKYLGNEEKWIKNIINEINTRNKLAKLNRKVNRILKIKEKYKVNNKKIVLDKEFLENINKKILQIRGECDMN